MTELQSKTIGAVRGNIPGFDAFSNSEKLVQVAAYLADHVAVREELGANHGKYVDDFLREAGGLGHGYPWCAASMNWICEALSLPNPDKADAAVIGWKNWAEANGRLKNRPARGRLCLYLHRDGTGHIGVVTRSDVNTVWSIEGNTSSGQAGSQRDGDGMYRRARKADTWQFYIDIN